MKTKTEMKQLLTTPVCGSLAAILMLCILGGSVSAQTPSLPEDFKLVASDGVTSEWFGRSVSIDGDVAIVGRLRLGDQQTRLGSAYIFRFDGSTWTEEAMLFASDGEPNDLFGQSFSISENVAIVGAKRDDLDGDGFGEGSAYIYRNMD